MIRLSVDNDVLDNYLSHDRNSSSSSSSRTIQEVASSTLIDSLAAEWWSINLSQHVINDLLENLLPIIVLGCEKVINEADERHLIGTTTPDRSFNPINRLASFLMRNNPKYMHYSTLSPYHYSMKSLLNTKKVQVLKVYGEEETLLRTILKQRQTERNEHHDVTDKEEERRKKSLKILFSDWNVPERGWIQTKLINNMLEQFNEVSKEISLKSNLPVFQSHRMHLGNFTENFFNGLNNESGKNFDSIINVYRRCAQTYSNIVQEHELDLLLQRVFNQLDEKQSGFLLRQNVMKLLQKFYKALNDQDKKNVNQPDQWPVLKQITTDEDIEDEDLSESEKEEEEKQPEVPEKHEHETHQQEKPSETNEEHKHDEAAKAGEHEKPDEATKTEEHGKPDEAAKTGEHEKSGEAPKTEEHEKTGEAAKTGEHEKAGEAPKTDEEEKLPERPKTNEQKTTLSTLPDANKKKDQQEKKDQKKKKEEEQEEADEEENKITIELKPPSAYEANYRFTKEHKSVYNLEHFDTDDITKSNPYDEKLIDKKQFSSLLISFSGLKKDEMIVSALIDFFRTTYKETDEEKTEKKTYLQQQLIDEQRRTQCDLLFEKINTSCTGLIKLEPLINILKQYKEGAAFEHIEQVFETYQDHSQISREQFFDLIINIYQTLNEALNGEEKLDDLTKYIDSQQSPLNPTDRTRIQTRQQWLKRIRNIPFRSVGHLYKEVMDIIQKDSNTFGSQPSKYLSIYIALLESNKNQLRYVATTNDQTDLLLGKTLQRDQGISFQVLENGRWAYINQTKNHSRIHFFNPDAKNESGSFVLMPLKRIQRKYSNGLLGIDTIQEQKEKAFVKHEVKFYEGITSVLSDTLTFIDFHVNMIKILKRFTYWIQLRHINVSSVDYYTYEPVLLQNPQKRVLEHVLTYSKENLTVFDTPITTNSREQVFKYYLEHAATTCQSTITSFLDQTHMIHAMRGRDKFCFGLIDTNIGEQTDLPHEQKQDLITMYHYIYKAADVLEQELFEDKTKQLLTYENQSEEMRLNYLFDRIWYKDICNKIKELTKEKIQEFVDNKSKWNTQIKDILSSISHIVKEHEINPSDYAKDLIPAMKVFDPTATENVHNNAWNHVEQSLHNIHQSTLPQTSSDIIKIFYEWLNLAYELHKISKTH
ncbi:unnamed protein product [Adineta steineri]|uniref:EF-hand domain-containing protein n=1 Tax=Adineta steineri TaxID=433720 RepID=A0A814DUM7_9BILA|nr:unnamed protein product [Adineta steineri]